MNFSALDTVVAKFRKTSPNVAAAFDETKVLLSQLEARVARLEPSQPTAPWQGWLHEVSGSRVIPPDRHFAYTDKTVTLTAFPDTPRLGADRQLVSAYLGGGAAQAVEGREVTYETVVRFEPGFQWTTGQLNWLIEWHTMSGQGAGKLSNAIGVATDYPVASSPGKNPRWYFRPTGPGGDRNVFGPAVEVGRSYSVRTAILWGSSVGRFRVWLDNLLVCDQTLPTLWTGDSPAFGLYLYRLAASWESSVTFSRPVVS